MIYTSNFVVTGTISNFPALYTNSMTAPDLSNITIHSGVTVDGDVFTQGRMDVGKTIFATFRLNSNVNFNGANEFSCTSNQLTMDWRTTDMSGMSNIPMVVPPYQVYNQATGVVTVPTSGIYHLSMQGSFSNVATGATNRVNGVCYKFLNHAHSNARVHAQTSPGQLVSTGCTMFLLGGDQFKPIFFSNDSNASLNGVDGETYVSFTVLATVSPTHSNYYRT